MQLVPRVLTPDSFLILRVLSTSKWPLKVSDERVQMYRARRNQHLAAAVTDGDHEPEVDPYAFEEGDVKFTFSNKKDKSGGEREPGKKHKVGPAKWRSEACWSARLVTLGLLDAVMDALCRAFCKNGPFCLLSL